MIGNEPTTSITISGVIIGEPITALTDLLVAAVCLYACLNLRKTSNPVPAVRLFAYYFLSMAIATAYGGIIGHAFIHLLSFPWKVPAWILSMVSVALLERSAIFHAQSLLPKSTIKFFAVLNVMELSTMIIVVLRTLNFFFVEAHAAYGLLVIVFSFELIVFLKTKNEASKFMLLAVGVAALAAGVHLFELAPHRWFNHLDLSHTLMAVAAYLFYRGAKTINATGNLKATSPPVLRA